MKKTLMNRWPAVAALTGLGLVTSICSSARADNAGANPAVAVEAEMKMMDSNGDGKLTAEEHAAGAKTMFAAMDLNHDGKVTAAEMEAAHDQVMGKAAGNKPAEKAEAKLETKPVGHMSAADKIKVIDKNGDGVLTADEHAAGSKMVFEKMDSDHDGFVSKAELAEGHARMLHKAAASAK